MDIAQVESLARSPLYPRTVAAAGEATLCQVRGTAGKRLTAHGEEHYAALKKHFIRHLQPPVGWQAWDVADTRSAGEQ